MSSEVAAEPETPPKAKAKRTRLRQLLALVGYTAILAFAWHAIDHDKLYEGLRRLNAVHVVAILFISLVHIDGRAYRFHRLLLRNHPTEYRWTDGFAIFLIGLSTSAVTPARAGDFVKAELVKKHGVSFSAGFGLVLIERMLDLVVLTTAIILAGFSLSSNAAAIWNRAAILLLIGLVAGLAALTSKGLRTRLIGLGTALLRKVSPAKADALSSKVDSIFVTWDAIFKSPVTLLSYFLGSCVIWSVEFAKLWCVLVFLGEPASLPAVFFVYPVSILAGVLTLLPFSEGVVGLTGVALLAALGGVDPAVATIAIVIDRGASGLPPIVLAMTSGLWRRR